MHQLGDKFGKLVSSQFSDRMCRLELTNPMGLGRQPAQSGSESHSRYVRGARGSPSCADEAVRQYAWNPDHRHDEDHERIEDEARLAIRKEHRFESFAGETEGNNVKW